MNKYILSEYRKERKKECSTAREGGISSFYADCLQAKAVKAFLMLATNAEKLLVSLTLSWNSAIQSRGGVQEVTEMTQRLDFYKKKQY